jgi:hypothetical protein
MSYLQPLLLAAKQYWGEPNERLTTAKQIRYGAHGSKSVDLEKETWYDHEMDKGGGLADLIHTQEPDVSVVDRMAEFGLPKTGDRIETAYDYRDADGVVRYQVVRIDSADGKTYRQRQIAEDGKPIYSMAGVTALPYRLPDIVGSTGPIFICEGERAADAVASLGFVATTAHGGAGRWWPTISDFFRGRPVIILPDNDEPGERHARIVADALTGTARSIRVLRLPNLPRKGDAVDWAIMGGTKDKLVELAKVCPYYDPLEQPKITDIVEEAQNTVDRPRISLTAWADIEDIDVQWTVDKLLPAGGLIGMYGRPGSYKSFVALYLSAMIATGQDAFGRSTVKGSVVYIMGEGGSGLKPRLDALSRHYGIDEPPVYFLRSQLNLRSTEDDAIALVQAINLLDVKPTMLVIDTLNRAFGGGDENTSEAMGNFISRCCLIQDQIGCSVLVVHHAGKNEAAGSRGHSSWLGALDAEYGLTKISDDDSPNRIGKLSVTKMKDGEDGFDIGYQMETVTLTPFGGKTSLACVPLDEAGMHELKAKSRPLSAIQQMVYGAIETALGEAGEIIASNHIPPNVKVVKLSLGRAYYYKMGGAEVETLKKRFQRAIDAMLHKGTLAVWGEYVWITDSCTQRDKRDN